jgi:hypothetical protein
VSLIARLVKKRSFGAFAAIFASKRRHSKVLSSLQSLKYNIFNIAALKAAAIKFTTKSIGV